MSRVRACIPLLALLLLARPVLAGDKALKTGGSFEVEVHKNIAYLDAKDIDERQKLDLYVAKGVKNYPTIFFIHRGAWRAGSRAGFDKIGRTFARNGVGFVAAGYRLSPKGS